MSHWDFEMEEDTFIDAHRLQFFELLLLIRKQKCMMRWLRGLPLSKFGCCVCHVHRAEILSNIKFHEKTRNLNKTLVMRISLDIKQLSTNGAICIGCTRPFLPQESLYPIFYPEYQDANLRACQAPAAKERGLCREKSGFKAISFNNGSSSHSCAYLHPRQHFCSRIS